MKTRAGAIIFQDNYILLEQYSYGGHKIYHTPGGKREKNELIEKTVERECKEELSLFVKPRDLLLVGEILQRGIETLHCVFWVDVVGGTPILNKKATKAEALRWVHVKELNHLVLYPQIGKYIQEAITLKSFSSHGYIGRIPQPWFSDEKNTLFYKMVHLYKRCVQWWLDIRRKFHS